MWKSRKYNLNIENNILKKGYNKEGKYNLYIDREKYCEGKMKRIQ